MIERLTLDSLVSKKDLGRKQRTKQRCRYKEIIELKNETVLRVQKRPLKMEVFTTVEE